jgi:hypothetical protein
MAAIKVGLVVDQRVGVHMVFDGTKLAKRSQWRIAYIGQYGFEGDPQPHTEFFEKLPEAVDRWKQLIEDYHSRCLSVDRLKAFKKDWVPLHVENDEAMLFFRDVCSAVMTSQGEKSRRKRIWWFVETWAGDVEPSGQWNKGLIPAELFKPGQILEPGTEFVPIRSMSKRINEIWDMTLKLYRERI